MLHRDAETGRRGEVRLEGARVGVLLCRLTPGSRPGGSRRRLLGKSFCLPDREATGNDLLRKCKRIGRGDERPRVSARQAAVGEHGLKFGRKS
jgi:hypothetical protein